VVNPFLANRTLIALCTSALPDHVISLRELCAIFDAPRSRLLPARRRGGDAARAHPASLPTPRMRPSNCQRRASLATSWSTTRSSPAKASPTSSAFERRFSSVPVNVPGV